MESIGQKRLKFKKKKKTLRDNTQGGDYNEVVHFEVWSNECVASRVKSTKPLSGTLLKVCDLMGALDGISPVLLGANDATGVLLMPGIAMT